MRKTAVITAILAVLVCAPLAGAKDKDKDKERFQHAGPVKLDRDGEKWAEKTLKGMSLEEKVGQMFMIWARAEFLNVNSPEYLNLRDTMRKYHIGGFGLTVHVYGPLLLKSGPFEAAALVNQLQRDSKYPLIFAADFERGVSMRLNGSTVFPHAMAFGAAGDPKFAEEFGRITGEEARAIGVQWNWFPVADVNSNPANPIINTRAFGEDPRQVGDMVAAYIKGAHQSGMLTTLKHFPGHGDTATDSHLSLAMVSGDRHRLETVELPPFKRGIEAGTDSVMVAHVTVPALDPAPDHVASNSPVIVQDLLKRQLGFKGIVVTDAVDMNGLMRLYSTGGANPSALAAVATVKAGNDMVIIPADIDAAYNGVLNAVRSGEIYEKQIDASVLKILKAKASVGLNKARFVDLDALQRTVADPKSVAEAQEVADRAVTLVKDSRTVLPFTPDAPQGTNDGRSPYARAVRTTNKVVALIFTDDLRAEGGRAFAQELRARVPDASVIWIDPNNADFSAQAVLSAVNGAEKVIAAVYEVPSAGRTLAFSKGPTALLRSVLERAANKTALVAMGNPYVATDYPQASTLLCTFSNAQVSEVSAVKALFGEIPVRGRLPVSIPQVAERGAGIDRTQVAGGINAESKGNAAP
jgi:beta-N-acetylhexosaminidase